VVALDNVDLELPVGGTLGVIGESGSGKSTLARCLLGLLPADDGSVRLLGQEIVGMRERDLRRLRREVQIVFQEPFESLDPRLRIGEAVAEPLLLHTDLSPAARRSRAGELLEMVSLDPALADRFPHQLSGGQQQRVNIARALATHPRLLVLDEPTASLDVSVRADILRLLGRLRDELELSYVLISHDFPTIRSLSSHIAVVHSGSVVEHGPASTVLTTPEHDYTRFLLASELPLDPASLESS
jgi:ABC-type glutathione transport system ATPase component